MRLSELDRATAERALHQLDRAHAEYLRRFYDVDINDPGLYHLMLDATAFSEEFCVETIARAARQLAATPGGALIAGQTKGSNGV
jgi:cytidylate kinase